MSLKKEEEEEAYRVGLIYPTGPIFTFALYFKKFDSLIYIIYLAALTREIIPANTGEEQEVP